jgi:sulfopyruvate decarboxylase subunit beta
VAEAIGFQKTFFFADGIDFKKALDTKGPVFVHVKVLPGNADVPVIPLEPEEIKQRFLEEVQGKK